MTATAGSPPPGDGSSIGKSFFRLYFPQPWRIEVHNLFSTSVGRRVRPTFLAAVVIRHNQAARRGPIARESMNQGRAAVTTTSRRSQPTEPQTRTHDPDVQTTRETIESVVVAVVLAFLFRAFVAEAFVIPTGSMAPTLQGRHLDIYCDQCGHRYQTGASTENGPTGSEFVQVDATTCPVCRYTMQLDRSDPNTLFFLLGNRDAFNGDRILVSKFAYQVAEPERWDVIVFKYPGNAKQNYIKRLVGLPGETLWIRHGDVFVLTAEEKQKPESQQQVRIARKNPDKVKAMLQLVDDTDNIGSQLRAIGWPSRWKQSSSVTDENAWKISDDESQFRVAAASEESWLRYRHFAPWPSDWAEMLETGNLPARLDYADGQLILDYYAYNDSNANYDRFGGRTGPSQAGTSWVGDLAIEANVAVKSDDGHLLLKLVEGGVVFDCRIDVGTGKATLTIDGGSTPFENDGGETARVVTAQTRLRGAGSYHLRFANVDDKLFLWVNERSIEFDFPPTFSAGSSERPKWTPEDPLDLAPLGIGGQNIEMQVTRLKVLRDIYYLAIEVAHRHHETNSHFSTDELLAMAEDPHQWATTDQFSSRREEKFELAADQFFPMGDNSPQSKDARLWSNFGDNPSNYDDPPPYVERRYLIGKALLIYWPHAWRPFWPNFSRMGPIR